MLGRHIIRQCFQVSRSSLVQATNVNTRVAAVLSSVQSPTVHTHRYMSGVNVQHPAPDFQGTAVVNNDFKQIKLSDFKGKYLVLFFYPLDFHRVGRQIQPKFLFHAGVAKYDKTLYTSTFVCPTEIIAFSDKADEFKAINAEIIGVSCDSHFSHLAWINTPRKSGGLGGLKFPLLADFNKDIARNYNVLLEKDGVPLRGMFIIDPNGIVRQITVNDLPVGRSVDEVLRLVKAFQFTDKHGEVCPAGWQPDAPTIKPTPAQSQEYFNKVNK